MGRAKKKVMLAMSGGVDSSVAAHLLLRQGYEVAGVFLHFWKEAGASAENRCCSLDSLNDARRVAEKLGIPLYTFDFSAPFKAQVVDYFLEEYAAGRTPNPCVACNKNIKLGRLLGYARSLGFDYVSSGHYIRLEKKGREMRLFRAKDKLKDQSYFLYTFTQDEMRHLLFPLGKYTKPQVRAMARRLHLASANRPESQDICFLSGDHNDFLKRHLPLRAGEIRRLDTKEVIGKHQGLPLYTIGQRRGLVGGIGPFYVAKLDYSTNTLYVVKDWQDDFLYRQDFKVKPYNWLSGQTPKRPLKCQAIIRYGHKAESCTLEFKRGFIEAKFAKPQRAITPGQSAVFYQKDRLLGGGVIL